MISSVKRGSATGKRRVLGGVLFARDGIEKPEDSMRIRTGGQIRTGGLPGCGFGSRIDWGRPARSIYESEAVDVPRSGRSVAPTLQIPLPGTTRLWGNDQGGQREERPWQLRLRRGKRSGQPGGCWLRQHQKRGNAQQYMIGKHPNGPFCSWILGDKCWGDELERGGGQPLWGDGQSQGQGESAPLTAASERGRS